MTVVIDSRMRPYHADFFQNAMYVPGDMVGRGFRVNRGAPDFGRVYSYTVRARFTNASENTNIGSTLCPADIVPAYLPLVWR